jgi:hypothetical protein
MSPARTDSSALAGKSGTRTVWSAAEHSGSRVSDWFAGILKVALVTIGAAGVAGWLVLAVFHLHDRYRVGHVQGHWMALAQYANEGILYPPLADGVRFGGTRHMPMPILLNAAAGRLTGEYLTSGKAVGIALFGTLLVVTFLALRQVGCPWPLAVGLTGLLPATSTGVLVGSVPGGDVLSVVLQVGALLAATAAVRSDRRGSLMAAGILAGLGACAKLTGLWASLAILSWLALRKEWSRLARVAVVSAATAAVVFVAVQWASQGRFLTTFLTFAFAGTGGPVGAIRAPNQLMLFALQDAPAVWIIAPFALLGVFAAGCRSGLTLYHHGLGWSLLLTLVVFTDMGAGLNQLLDVSVLTIVAVGLFAARLPTEQTAPTSVATALTVIVMWAGVTGVRGFVPDLREAVGIARTGELPPKYRPRPLAAVVGPGETLLAEDPGIPVLLGQTPIILDAFMLRRFAELKPETVDALVGRIARREFDHVAMVVPLDEDDFWWQYYHLGLRIATALREAYVFTGKIDGYYVYAPHAHERR